MLFLGQVEGSWLGSVPPSPPWLAQPYRCATDLSRVLITKSGLADLHLRYNAALFGDGPREECDLLHEEMMQVRSQRKASKEKTMTKPEKSMRRFALALHTGIIHQRVPLVQFQGVAVHASAQAVDAPAQTMSAFFASNRASTSRPEWKFS